MARTRGHATGTPKPYVSPGIRRRRITAFLDDYESKAFQSEALDLGS